MSGTRITCTDVDTGESESRTIVDDYCLICDGNTYLDGLVRHANGTTVITVKRKAA